MLKMLRSMKLSTNGAKRRYAVRDFHSATRLRLNLSFIALEAASLMDLEELLEEAELIDQLLW